MARTFNWNRMGDNTNPIHPNEKRVRHTSGMATYLAASNGVGLPKSRRDPFARSR